VTLDDWRIERGKSQTREQQKQPISQQESIEDVVRKVDSARPVWDERKRLGITWPNTSPLHSFHYCKYHSDHLKLRKRLMKLYHAIILCSHWP